MKENMNKTYVFYMHSWYVWWTAEEEATSDEIWITENTTKEEDDKLLSEYFLEFMWNLDSGWYEKEDDE